jgi:hypothetical protein
MNETEPDLMLLVLEETKKQTERMDRMERTLRTLQSTVDGAVEMVRQFGLRLHSVECEIDKGLV